MANVTSTQYQTSRRPDGALGQLVRFAMVWTATWNVDKDEAECGDNSGMMLTPTGSAWEQEADEEVKLARRVQLVVGDALPGIVGMLSVTTQRVAFQPDSGVEARGFSLYYQAIVMHAVSRDTGGGFPPCIYLQLDDQHKLDLGGAASQANGHAAVAAPMDVCDEGGAAAEESEDDEESEDEEAQEVRLVPLAPEESDGGVDPALDRLFAALSECAALNPDAAEEGDDDEEEGEEEEEEEGVYGGAALALDPADAQALLSGASTDQLAMLARYDAMLEASGSLPPTANSDGRYDDPDEPAEQTGSPAPPSAPPGP